MKVKVTQSCLTLCDPMHCTVHGILQARILEWVAFPFPRGSSQPRDQTQVSPIASGFFTSWATGKPKNTRVGSLSLLQRIILTQELNRCLLHCRWVLYQVSYQGSPNNVMIRSNPCFLDSIFGFRTIDTEDRRVWFLIVLLKVGKIFHISTLLFTCQTKMLQFSFWLFHCFKLQKKFKLYRMTKLNDLKFCFSFFSLTVFFFFLFFQIYCLNTEIYSIRLAKKLVWVFL